MPEFFIFNKKIKAQCKKIGLLCVIYSRIGYKLFAANFLEVIGLKKILQRGLSLLLVLFMGLAPLSFADGYSLIGTATVTARNYLNVREGGSTGYPIITTVPEGASYPVISQARSGWYELLLPDGRTGFVSNNLVDFTPGVQNIGGVLPVYYRTIDGKLLNTVYVSLSRGQNTITADYSKVPQGYRLQGSGSATVNVDAYGNAQPAAVLFLFAPQTSPNTGSPSGFAAITIRYIDNWGRELSKSSVYLRPGSHLLYANANKLPPGYSLTGAKDAVVSVSQQLVANPSVVNFTASYGSYPNATLPPYPIQTATPALPQIPVYYQTTSGTWLNTQYVQLNYGYNTVTANDSLVPSGYTRYSGSSISVYVDNAGNVSPNAVIFQYQQKPAQEVSVSVPVYYRSGDGSTLATDYVLCKQGYNSIYANSSKVPAGYELQSYGAVSVYVSSNGTASPSSVVFTYAKPVQANLTVIYQDNAGNLLRTEYIKIGPGTHTVYADDSKVPNGYKRISAQSATVYVDSNGSANPAGLAFVYAPPQPATAPPVTQAPQPTPTGTPFVVPTQKPPVNTPIPTTVPEPSSKDYHIPSHKTGSISSENAVYSGPGTQYYRAANGRANVKSGRCRFYGLDGDWAMMGYQYGDDYRIGYIPASGVPSGLNLSQLDFMYQDITVIQDANFNDDPILSPTKIGVISSGTQVKLLGIFNNHWAYIETTLEGKPARGFINKARIGK